MTGRAIAHELAKPGCAAACAVGLAVFVWAGVAGAVDPPKSLLGTLPARLTGQGLGEVLPPPKQVVPVAEPIKDQDIDVEHDAGLISLAVRNASLRQVVALVADTQKLNLVFAAPVDVPITASFDHIPWPQVLDSLLSATGHTWTDNGGVIFVTSVELADKVAPQAGGRHVQVFELDFAAAVDINQTVLGLLSPAGKSWVLESSIDDNRRSREAVAVVDYPANLAQIADYIWQADQPPRQVMIQAHILQVDLDDDCRNGILWEQVLGEAGNQFNFGFLSPGVFNPSKNFTDPGATSTSFLVMNTPNLNSIVEALQTTTDAKTLASPRLLVVNGQEANIQIGERIGYRETTTTQTSSLETVKFLDVGVVLTVMPRITRDGRVLMRVNPKVSTGQVDPATGLPNEETTEVGSDILLEDGQGMVIGGLIQEKDENTQNKVPWLGDIPYAGALFQRRQVVKTRSELIVTLIPHVLPYTPMLAQRDCYEFMRSAQPLTYGAIHRYPRPYEPRMPDTFTNARTVCDNVQSLPPAMPHKQQRLVRLPPVALPAEACVTEQEVVESKPEPGSDYEYRIVNPMEARRLPRVYR